jgi:hypothetical protein
LNFGISECCSNVGFCTGEAWAEVVKLGTQPLNFCFVVGNTRS